MESDFIDDFIKEYKNQPCLWQASSVDYKNRKKRQEAYYKLIEVASKHGEHYNIERTKQKINNLRCAFRHQLRKFTESKNNKTGKEDNYCPKRRYFESLMFLLNEEQPNCSKDSITSKEKSHEKNHTEIVQENNETYTTVAIMQEAEENSKESSEIITQPIIKDDMEIEAHKNQENNVHIEMQCDDDVNLLWPNSTTKSNETVLHMTTSSQVETESRPRAASVCSNASSHTSPSESAQKKIKIDCSASNFEKLLSLACSKMNNSEKDDNFGIFGKMVAYKLRSMDTHQSIIAEKLINDILTEGQMKMLSYPTVRTVPYRQEGQAFVISGLNINGTADTQTDRQQSYATQTIQYSVANGTQL